MLHDHAEHFEQDRAASGMDHDDVLFQNAYDAGMHDFVLRTPLKGMGEETHARLTSLGFYHGMESDVGYLVYRRVADPACYHPHDTRVKKLLTDFKQSNWAACEAKGVPNNVNFYLLPHYEVDHYEDIWLIDSDS